jgi:nitric oxide reductase NorE protein
VCQGGRRFCKHYARIKIATAGYAGATRFQTEAGFEDSVNQMFAYLQQEVGDVVIKHEPYIPGETGIWVLILGDLIVFSLLFCVFLYYRGQSTDVFTQSHRHLNQFFGALNTFLMLTSSWLVASAVQRARQGSGRITPLLLGALACGSGFGIVKVFEWGEKIRAGITLTTNEFYMFYYMFTGIHMGHVLIGMGVLTFMVLRTRHGGIKVQHLESGAIFWHLVDLLWIVLFALLYLVN